MEFIDKLFKQYPFIYFIGGRYYAFGTGVCVKCDSRIIDMDHAYKVFENSIDRELTPDEACKIFRHLVNMADFFKEEIGVCFNPKEEIINFHFDEDELEELKKQVERYVDYWKKYSLNEYSF